MADNIFKILGSLSTYLCVNSLYKIVVSDSEFYYVFMSLKYLIYDGLSVNFLFLSPVIISSSSSIVEFMMLRISRIYTMLLRIL